MIEPVPGLKFSSVQKHALPALRDGFEKKSTKKNEWSLFTNIYPNNEVLDDFERKHILEIRPSVTLAKNVKRKVLVRGSKLISLR